jgi:hypothetical protein
VMRLAEKHVQAAEHGTKVADVSWETKEGRYGAWSFRVWDEEVAKKVVRSLMREMRREVEVSWDYGEMRSLPPTRSADEATSTAKRDYGECHSKNSRSLQPPPSYSQPFYVDSHPSSYSSSTRTAPHQLQYHLTRGSDYPYPSFTPPPQGLSSDERALRRSSLRKLRQ